MPIQRVAILYGGPSPEAEISEKSAKEVKSALDKLGYEAFLIEFSPTFIQDIKSAFTDKSLSACTEFQEKKEESKELLN